MKKNDKIKIILLIGLVMTVLTWFIAGGTYNDSGVYTVGEIQRAGIFDFLMMFYYNFYYRLINVFYILVVGGCYGVLSRTKSYRKLVDNAVAFVKGKEIPVMLIITLLMGIYTSLCSEILVLFMFVPFIISVFLKCGKDRLTAISAAIGGIFIGMIGITYGTYGVSNMISALEISYGDGIGFKIALFVLSYVLFNFFAIIHINKQYKDVDDTKYDMFNTEVLDESKIKKSRKTKVWPMMIIIVLTIIIAGLAFINWETSFGVTIFGEVFENIQNVEIGGIPVIYNLLGQVSEFGSWDLILLSSVMLIAVLIVSLMNKMSLEESISHFMTGMSRILKVAFIYGLVFFGFNVVYWFGWPVTVVLKVLGTKFNMFTVLIAGMLSSFLFVDTEFIGYSLGSHILTNFSSNLVSTHLIMNVGAALIQVIAPTSFILMMALTYLNVPYKKWLGYIWKYTLALLIVVILVFAVMCYM